MLGLFTFALAVAAADPRPELVELQLAGQPQQALARVEQEIAQHPQESRRLDLDYLRGHLLDTLHRFGEASDAFVRALASAPAALQPYSRYRLALDHYRLGHPEVAAGLVASVVSGEPRSPLIAEAVRLLDQALAEGGDCQLLSRLRAEALPAPQRREIELARGGCSLRTGYSELARSLLVSLIQEDPDDETARRAAEQLAGLVSEAEHGRVPMLLGFTFQQHDDFDRALPLLQRAQGKGDALSSRDAYETQLRIGLALLAQQRFAEAALAFSRLAALAKTPDDRARAFYQEARAHELRGAWPAAGQRFQQAYLASPQASWAAPALLSALRIAWRGGAEAPALGLYAKLAAVPKWRGEAARAALFLAASDLVRGRADRAAPWLSQARLGGSDDRLEADYWDARRAELERNEQEAVALYLKVLRADPHHPLAGAARARLAADPLARFTLAEGRRLAASAHRDNVYSGWLLLSGDPAGQAAAQRRLEQMLLADRAAAPYLRLAQVPVRRWPMWSQPLTRPVDLLLALGAWHQGAPAVRTHFPLSDPPLAFTGALLLARGGELGESIETTQELVRRAPSRIPPELLPRELRQTLYPFPYRVTILAQGQIRGVDPYLLAALIREESRFDPSLLSPASGRGLTRLSYSTARRLAAQLKLERLTPEDLYRPEVSIALGAAHLGALLKDFGGGAIPALAGYQAGEPEAAVWRNQCFSQDPAELYTKIGTSDARDYVRRVLEAREQYAALY